MQGLDRIALMPLQHVDQLLGGHLETFEKRGGIGIFFGSLDGSLDVVEDGQKIAHERETRIAALILKFPSGPFAKVVQFGAAAEFAILGRGEFGLEFFQGFILCRRSFGLWFRLGFRLRYFYIFSRRFRLFVMLGMFTHGQNNSLSFSKKLFRVGET